MRLFLNSARTRWAGSLSTGTERTGLPLNKARKGFTHPKVMIVIYIYIAFIVSAFQSIE